MPADTPFETGLFDRQKTFWENYHRGRPVIPASFYQRFYDYHSSHNGSFGTVHDVGAGYGELSLELAKKFSHVIVGDPAEKSLAVAKELMESKGDPSQFSFRQERIEQSDLGSASVDAIFCCNAIHWTDVDRAMAVVTDQLKPGGTLFICLNGLPKYDEKIQPAWWRMVDECFVKVATRMPKADIQRILALQDDGYDSIPIPPSDYEPGAVRLKLNVLGNPDAFVQGPATSDHSLRCSRVGPAEKRIEEVDKDWFFDVDVQGLRATVGSYPFDPEPELLERNLAELDKLLQGGTCEGHWPVSIIMATRK